MVFKNNAPTYSMWAGNAQLLESSQVTRGRSQSMPLMSSIKKGFYVKGKYDKNKERMVHCHSKIHPLNLTRIFCLDVIISKFYFFIYHVLPPFLKMTIGLAMIKLKKQLGDHIMLLFSYLYDVIESIGIAHSWQKSLHGQHGCY